MSRVLVDCIRVPGLICLSLVLLVSCGNPTASAAVSEKQREHTLGQRASEIWFFVGAAANIGDYLEAQGHSTDFALDGLVGLHLAVTNEYAAIVLDNLVSNALARTERGEVAVAFANGTLTVKDTGPGIPAELLSKVVEAHVKHQRSTGQGWGLSIVHTLCERFGWLLTFDSREGEGTWATLDLAPMG